MATTHALIGAALAAVTVVVAPELAPVAMAAGFVGGLVPDFDLYVGHRRTLHFPVYYTLAAIPALVAAFVVPTPGTVALAWLLVGAATHAAMDVLGGGLELRPWDGRSERAVYSHYHGTWLRPRRWVPYDGAPQDLALAVVVGLPALLVARAPIQQAIATALVVSMGYTVLRKPLAEVAAVLAGFVPGPLRPYVPERYL